MKTKIEKFPVSRIGETSFLGYPVAIGSNDDGAYLECDYDETKRYLLPLSRRLRQMLYNVVEMNMSTPHCIKVWIKRTEKGWEVKQA